MNQQSPTTYTVTARTETRVALAVAGVPVPVVIDQSNGPLHTRPGVFTTWDPATNTVEQNLVFTVLDLNTVDLTYAAAVAAVDGMRMLNDVNGLPAA